MRKILLLIITISSFSCEPEIENKPDFNSGNLDLSNYLAVGDGWTAGTNNNGLNAESQSYAYPNLLAQQFALVGGGDFKQPLVEDEIGSGSYRLIDVDGDVCEGTTPLPELEIISAAQNWDINVSGNGPFNNLGVQRMPVRSLDDDSWSNNLFQNLDSINNNGPHLKRLVNPEVIDTTSYIDLVKNTVSSTKPTFFTSWFGFSDVLIYAGSGGGFITGDPFGPFNCDLSPELIGAGDATALTDVDLFEANYRKLLDEIIFASVDTPRGALMNLPFVTQLPYFSAVNNALKYKPEEEKDNESYLDTLFLRRVPNCEELIPVYGTTGPFGDFDTIQADINDFPLLTTRFSFGETPAFPACATNNEPHGFTSESPLLNSEFLDKSEEEQARVKINQYNKIIEALAEEYNFVYVDMEKLFEKLNPEKDKDILVYNGVEVSAEYMTGNFFGLDGLHFTPLGNAIVTNRIITALNEAYDANIPRLIETEYPAVSFP